MATLLWKADHIKGVIPASSVTLMSKLELWRVCARDGEREREKERG